MISGGSVPSTRVYLSLATRSGLRCRRYSGALRRRDATALFLLSLVLLALLGHITRDNHLSGLAGLCYNPPRSIFKITTLILKIASRMRDPKKRDTIQQMVQ